MRKVCPCSKISYTHSHRVVSTISAQQKRFLYSTATITTQTATPSDTGIQKMSSEGSATTTKTTAAVPASSAAVSSSFSFQKGAALIDVSTCPASPLSMWQCWAAEAEAKGVYPPYGQPMALATSTSDGFPSVRMVLLKGADARGFTFFTNYESRKGAEIHKNPKASFVIYWEGMGNSGRQVRVEGFVEKLSAHESDVYFNSRHIISRLGATCSQQSSEIPSREFLEAKVEALQKELGSRVVEVEEEVAGGEDGVPIKRKVEREVPVDPVRPPYWGGFVVVPTSIEFWCNGFGRLHDRVVYKNGPVRARDDAPSCVRSASDEDSLSSRHALGSEHWNRVRLSP